MDLRHPPKAIKRLSKSLRLSKFLTYFDSLRIAAQVLAPHDLVSRQAGKAIKIPVTPPPLLQGVSETSPIVAQPSGFGNSHEKLPYPQNDRHHGMPAGRHTPFRYIDSIQAPEGRRTIAPSESANPGNRIVTTMKPPEGGRRLRQLTQQPLV